MYFSDSPSPPNFSDYSLLGPESMVPETGLDLMSRVVPDSDDEAEVYRNAEIRGMSRVARVPRTLGVFRRMKHGSAFPYAGVVVPDSEDYLISSYGQAEPVVRRSGAKRRVDRATVVRSGKDEVGGHKNLSGKQNAQAADMLRIFYPKLFL